MLFPDCCVEEMPKDIQPLGGDDGVKAMEKADFINVKKIQVTIPLHVPSGVGVRELFSFMVKPTPINVRRMSLPCHVLFVGKLSVCMLVTSTQYPVEVYTCFY